MSSNIDPAVAILMATYNGEKFLDLQLSSLFAQDWAPVDLLISDDGSSDGTLQVLEAWKSKWNKGSFKIVPGPRRGFAENFRSLILAYEGHAGYLAFCDQDDIWLKSKLRSAIEQIGDRAGGSPALYCSRTELIDDAGRPAGLSRKFGDPPRFGNAVLQSIGGGNTMVMNRSAFAIVRESVSRTDFVSHDWWSYMIVSGAGGKVIYDDVPHIQYRQHGGNAVGENRKIGASLKRVVRLLSGGFRSWNARNESGLLACKDLLTDENVAILNDFMRMRTGSPFSRVWHFWRSGIRRQSMLDNAMIGVASFFGRI